MELVEEVDWPAVADYHKQYRVLRQIASGAFGSVHCVQRRDTKVIQAAKYVKSSGDDLRREVDALLALRKSSLILQFVAFYASNPSGVLQSVLVTEFLAGGDLCERTSAKDYVLTEAKCRTIVRQICRGVQFIHASGFVHLDLKPFNIVFAKKRDDYDLRIIDFGLARELVDNDYVNVGMCGTIEYMSPEVMNCTPASTASDCWGIGVITYQLISGGISPFFAVNRFRTMARVLECDYSLEQAELIKASWEAKDFISMLLRKEPKKRLTTDQCLEHAWLRDDKLYLGILQTLETGWMRRCLARRRWYRLFNALRVMARVRKATAISNSSSWDSTDNNGRDNSSEEDLANGGTTMSFLNKPPFVHALQDYYVNFDKMHLIVNNGQFGTVFSVQRNSQDDLFAARHVRNANQELREEAAILYQLRNVAQIIKLEGLYEGVSQSVLVTEYLCGGDLAERVTRPDFVLNESKCKRFIRQICLGLEYIHKNRILHLDMKPFSIVFANVEDDSDLRIADFSLAKRINSSNTKQQLRISTLSGTVEFLPPEMIECTYATYATDCWGLGVISYMLITGGKSPFYGGNRFRTIARILSCQYQLDIPELHYISQEAKEFIRQLLTPAPGQRMTAAKCLQHRWLTSDAQYGDALYTLETRWMKQLLARRRWHRWYNAVRATQRIRKFSAATRVSTSSTGGPV